MKKVWLTNLVLVAVLGSAVLGVAKPRIYKWVKDKRVSSDDVLRKSQYTRVVPVPESRAQELIQTIMTDDLYLSLAQYHTTKHKQDAETTMDSVLPEEVVRQKEIELIDEDYRFILEVNAKRYGNRTRITAKASPVYRLRDWEAEEARDGDDTSGGNEINVKIKAGQGGAVAMGPIVVAPILGLPRDYHIKPLPDASARAGEIVKSFMYFLDRHVKESKRGQMQESPAASKEGESEGPADAAAPAATGGEDDGVEVEVNIKTKN